MNELEQATVVELVDELARRFGAVVVAACGPTENSEVEEDFHLYYRGGLTACVGLSSRAHATLQQDGLSHVGKELDD